MPSEYCFFVSFSKFYLIASKEIVKNQLVSLVNIFSNNLFSFIFSKLLPSNSSSIQESPFFFLFQHPYFEKRELAFHSTRSHALLDYNTIQYEPECSKRPLPKDFFCKNMIIFRSLFQIEKPESSLCDLLESLKKTCRYIRNLYCVHGFFYLY